MINSDFALGVHALILLATSDDGRLTSGFLSEKLKVHPVRIRNLLSKIRNRGFIQSKEGASGGFSICCDISAISLKDLYIITQEDILKPKCHDCCPTCVGGSKIENILGEILNGADQRCRDYLEGYTLKDVLDMM